MRSLTRLMFPFLLALMVTSLLACASTETTQAPGEYLDDSVVTAKVKTAIFNEPELKVLEITVETFRGEVQLSGFVGSRADANRAVAVAGTVEGVRSVRNDMRIK